MPPKPLAKQVAISAGSRRTRSEASRGTGGVVKRKQAKPLRQKRQDAAATSGSSSSSGDSDSDSDDDDDDDDDESEESEDDSDDTADSSSGDGDEASSAAEVGSAAEQPKAAGKQPRAGAAHRARKSGAPSDAADAATRLARHAAAADPGESALQATSKRAAVTSVVVPGMCCKVPITIGSVALPLLDGEAAQNVSKETAGGTGGGGAHRNMNGSNKAKQHRSTHEWICYVTPAASSSSLGGPAVTDLGEVIHSVEFRMHASFGRQASQVVTRPPFAVVRAGWDDVRVVLLIRLKPDGAQSLLIQHTVRLRTPLWHVPTLRLLADHAPSGGGTQIDSEACWIAERTSYATDVVSRAALTVAEQSADGTHTDAAKAAAELFASPGAPCVVETCDHIVMRAPLVSVVAAPQQQQQQQHEQQQQTDPHRAGAAQAPSQCSPSSSSGASLLAPSQSPTFDELGDDGFLTGVVPRRFLDARRHFRERVAKLVAATAAGPWPAPAHSLAQPLRVTNLDGDASVTSRTKQQQQQQHAISASHAAGADFVVASPLLCAGELGVDAATRALDIVLERALRDLDGTTRALAAAQVQQAAAMASMDRAVAAATGIVGVCHPRAVVVTVAAVAVTAAAPKK